MWNIWEILLIVIGLGLLMALLLARSGAKFPWIKKHEMGTLVVALVALFLAFVMVAGVLNIGTTTTTTTTQTTTNYALGYSLSKIQAEASASNTATSITLASSLLTINNANGVFTNSTLYSTGYKDFIDATNHNATIGQAVFEISLTRTDLSLNNMTFSISVPSVPSLVNTTTSSSYYAIAQNSAGQFEAYFANQTQTPNVHVGVLGAGATTTFWVTINYNVNFVSAMSDHQSVTFNVVVSFGTGQSISIPVELYRTA